MQLGRETNYYDRIHIYVHMLLFFLFIIMTELQRVGVVAYTCELVIDAVETQVTV